MDLRDATLMFLTESERHPAVAQLAQSAYEQLTRGEAVDYRLLKELIGAASGKGVLRDLHSRYSPTAYDAILTPILTEIDRQAPVPPRRRAPGYAEAEDPLTAPAW